MEELASSELGTLEYWNKRYTEEIKNFKSHGDPGEIWFGEDCVDRIISWISRSDEIRHDSKIVDVGCGNGMLLTELAKEKYSNLHGVDYSKTAIALAEAVSRENDVSIHYNTTNVLEGLPETYDVIHDKGTYDAISLSSNAAENRQKYIASVHNALKDGGFFMITSCNWTQDELHEQFKMYFQCVDIIPTPQFKFGGKIGSVVSSVVYKKMCKD